MMPLPVALKSVLILRWKVLFVALHACDALFASCRCPSFQHGVSGHGALEMTRVVSAEGAALVEAQTSALFGDLKQLQRQMQVLRARAPARPAWKPLWCGKEGSE